MRLRPPMNFLEPATIQCPYCGEEIDITVDTSVAEQNYIEDCQVCCKPIEIYARAAENEILDLFVHSDSD